MRSGVRIGSLFSGAGGLDLAVEAVFGGETRWVCEVDPAASKVLAHRFPDAPNLGDITKVDWARVEPVDVLCGGFPCQDVSTAGRRAGLGDGTRSGLWAVFAGVIEALRPSFVVIENVRGLVSAVAHRQGEDDDDSGVEPGEAVVGGGSDRPVLRAAGAVLGDLADLGYDAQWTTVTASSVGAPHRRERIFILAHPAGRARDGWAAVAERARGAGGDEEQHGVRAGVGAAGELGVGARGGAVGGGAAADAAVGGRGARLAEPGGPVGEPVAGAGGPRAAEPAEPGADAVDAGHGAGRPELGVEHGVEAGGPDEPDRRGPGGGAVADADDELRGQQGVAGALAAGVAPGGGPAGPPVEPGPDGVGRGAAGGGGDGPVADAGVHGRVRGGAAHDDDGGDARGDVADGRDPAAADAGGGGRAPVEPGPAQHEGAHDAAGGGEGVGPRGHGAFADADDGLQQPGPGDVARPAAGGKRAAQGADQRLAGRDGGDGQRESVAADAVRGPVGVLAGGPPAEESGQEPGDGLGDRGGERPVAVGRGAGLGVAAGVGAGVVLSGADLLPTPRAMQFGQGSAEHPNGTRKSGRSLGDELVNLLPTPSASDGAGGKTSRSGARKGELLLGGLVRTLSDDPMLPTPRATRGGSSTETADLLPTPQAFDAVDVVRTPEQLAEVRAKTGRSARGNGNLRETAANELYPTPAARDFKGVSSPAWRGRKGARGTPTLPDALFAPERPEPAGEPALLPTPCAGIGGGTNVNNGGMIHLFPEQP